MESLEEKVTRVIKEEVDLVEYDPDWLAAYEEESRHLKRCAPPGLIRRSDHVGSTSIPGLPAKPIIDVLVEVKDLKRARDELAPMLESQGYDFFERPTRDEDGDPTYLWFIKRDAAGKRTHHIHMVDDSPEHAHHRAKLVFRDYLLEHPNIASEYGDLKQDSRSITTETGSPTREQKPNLLRAR